MKNQLVSFIAIFLLASAGTAHAQVSPPMEGPQEAFTLQRILDSIDVNNPGLQRFALKTQASLAMGDAARSWEAPEAGGGLSEFPYPGNTKNQGMMPREMFMLQLQQMFPNFSKQKKEQAYYQSFAEQNKDDRATVENMLFAKAKMAYEAAYIAEKKLSVVAQQEKQLRLLIKIAEGRLAYHQAVLPDIYKARAKLGDLQSLQIRILSQTEESAAILNSLMNRPADASLRIDTTEEITFKQVNILQVDTAYVLSHRSDIRHTKDEIHTLDLEKEISAAANKPVFGISWDNMRMNHGGYMYSAMAMVSIPLAPWSSKGYKSEVRSMEYRIQAMQDMKNNQVVEALGTIRKDWLQLQSARKDLEIFQTEVIPAYTKTFQAYLNALSENTGDIYETLSAWNDLTTKRMEYYDKLANLFNIRTTLETEMQP